MGWRNDDQSPSLQVGHRRPQSPSLERLIRTAGAIVLAAILGSPLELVAQRVRDEVVDTHVLALLATNYSLFFNEYPKTNFDVADQLRFGLSEPGRFLLDLNASVRRELGIGR